VQHVWIVLALACMQAAQAAGADPQSAPCRAALAALQAREADWSNGAASQPGARIATDARWQALRRQATRACLGAESAAASAPLPRSAAAPIVVPPVTVAPPPATARPAPREIAPSLPVAPPVTLRSCDPNGCWTSDGQRVPHAGRDPLDPRVHCTLQGRLALCL
jgi:hypothetical protein